MDTSSFDYVTDKLYEIQQSVMSRQDADVRNDLLSLIEVVKNLTSLTIDKLHEAAK